jgi:hypothetical protein
LRQRIIALVAAYAIALASLIAGFSAAEATAAALDGGAGIICHSDQGAGGSPTGSHDSNAAICLKSCVGCMASLGMVIPPTLAAAGLRMLSFKRLDLPAFSLLRAGARSNAHRSRGPPPAL